MIMRFFFFWFFFIKACCGYSFELHRQVDAIQMSTNNICLYKEVDKKYTCCILKNTELLDCALIGICAVIRSNTLSAFGEALCLDKLLLVNMLWGLMRSASGEMLGKALLICTQNMFSWTNKTNVHTVFTLSILTPPYHICSKIWTSTIHYPMLCLKIAGWVANSVDPDETPHSILFAQACVSEYMW